MNTDKLIPIDFSRNITLFVIDDLIWDDIAKKEFKIKEEFKQLYHLNNSTFNDNHLYVISFADRPNNGSQPVGSEVAVDMEYYYNHKDFGVSTWLAGQLTWEAQTTYKSWKPNHSSMLKQYQTEQVLKSLNEGDNTLVRALQVEALGDAPELVVHCEQEVTGDTSHLDFDSGFNASAYEESCKAFEEDEAPAFTQAMADAGESLKLGMRYLDEDGQLCEFIGANGPTIVGRYIELAVVEANYVCMCDVDDIKPIQTDWKEKLKSFFNTPSACEDAFIEFRTENGTDGGELTEEEFIEMCQLVVSNLNKE
jgi:hypothetical protein